MALTEAQTREKLSACGIPADKLAEAVKWVMDGHINSINALREERDNYKADAEKYRADAEKLPKVQKELDDEKAKNEQFQTIKDQYETEHKNFSDYKAQIAAEKVKEKKTSLYKNLLKECDVGEKQIQNIIDVSGSVIDGIKLDKDGNIEDADNIKKQITEKWSGFIMHENQRGADVDNPPANEGTGKNRSLSHAAQMAANYHKNLYGEMKGD